MCHFLSTANHFDVFHCSIVLLFHGVHGKLYEINIMMGEKQTDNIIITNDKRDLYGPISILQSCCRGGDGKVYDARSHLNAKGQFNE